MLSFTKSIQIKKIIYLIDSILIIICTLFVESKIQKFIDSSNFSIRMVSILLSSLLAALRYIRVYIKTKLDKEGTLEGQSSIVHLVFIQYYRCSPEKNTGSLLYNLTEDVYKLMPWYTYGKIELTMNIFYFVCIWF